MKPGQWRSGTTTYDDVNREHLATGTYFDDRSQPSGTVVDDATVWANGVWLDVTWDALVWQ